MLANVATFLTLKQLEQSELACCVVLLSFYSLPKGQLHGVVVSTVSSHQNGPGFESTGPHWDLPAWSVRPVSLWVLTR